MNCKLSIWVTNILAANGVKVSGEYAHVIAETLGAIMLYIKIQDPDGKDFALSTFTENLTAHPMLDEHIQLLAQSGDKPDLSQMINEFQPHKPSVPMTPQQEEQTSDLPMAPDLQAAYAGGFHTLIDWYAKKSEDECEIEITKKGAKTVIKMKHFTSGNKHVTAWTEEEANSKFADLRQQFLEAVEDADVTSPERAEEWWLDCINWELRTY